jgi:hypothetical protein
MREILPDSSMYASAWVAEFCLGSYSLDEPKIYLSFDKSSLK